ncbi:hypothetical protein ASPCAL13564 [Aspergillus calidoustus]|uniref:Rhodopsin domain-containing protein n=1 Tax=Aspergillus calidoustus TaxID=454130 RepID=A0A0U5GH20_ASPCI|nr:hypothetical protein ASPCAL13564 [Aspergillus calidoustus]
MKLTRLSGPGASKCSDQLIVRQSSAVTRPLSSSLLRPRSGLRNLLATTAAVSTRWLLTETRHGSASGLFKIRIADCNVLILGLFCPVAEPLASHIGRPREMSNSFGGVDTVDTSYCGDRLLGVSIAIAVVQIVVVPARFYTRYIQHVTCTLDDYLIIPALIASLGQSALYIVLLQVAGLGYHFKYIQQTPEKLIALQKGLLANQILDFPFTVTPAKLSILLFYLRIFETRSFKMLSYIVGSLVLCHGTGVFFAAIFQCWPIQYTWDKKIVGGSCFNQQAFYRYVSLPNILTDFVILIMPMPLVWKLQTRLTHKLALTGVFLLGGLGLVTSILRMVIFFQESALTDPTWTSVNLGIWTVLEGGIIIIAACLPSIWPLIVRFLPNKLRSKNRGTSGAAWGKTSPGANHLTPKLNGTLGSKFSRLVEGASRGGRMDGASNDGEESMHSQARVMRDNISLRSLNTDQKEGGTWKDGPV